MRTASVMTSQKGWFSKRLFEFCRIPGRTDTASAEVPKPHLPLRGVKGLTNDPSEVLIEEGHPDMRVEAPLECVFAVFRHRKGSDRNGRNAGHFFLLADRAEKPDTAPL